MQDNTGMPHITLLDRSSLTDIALAFRSSDDPGSPTLDTSFRLDVSERRQQRALRFKALHEKHRPEKIFLFGEADFKTIADLNGIAIGLCAGLVHFWALETIGGRDAVACLRLADAATRSRVLWAQLLSTYIRTLPADLESLGTSERALIRFKYGSELEFRQLLLRANAGTMLELDLILQFGMNALKEWQGSGKTADVSELFKESPPPGLYLLVIRFWDSRRQNGERGHRMAIIVDQDQRCHFYDPRWGQLTFVKASHFRPWFVDYWESERWAFFLARGHPPESPLRVFHMPLPQKGHCWEPLNYDVRHIPRVPTLSELTSWLDAELSSAILAAMVEANDPHLKGHSNSSSKPLLTR